MWIFFGSDEMGAGAGAAGGGGAAVDAGGAPPGEAAAGKPATGRRRRRSRALPGRNRNGGNNMRGFRRFHFDRLLLTRDEIFGRARARCPGLVVRLRVAVAWHDLVRPVARLDDRRQRRQHRTTEHSAIAECAGRPDHRQAQHRHDDDQTTPARYRRLVVIIVRAVSLTAVVLLFVSPIAVLRRCGREGRHPPGETGVGSGPY